MVNKKILWVLGSAFYSFLSCTPVTFIISFQGNFHTFSRNDTETVAALKDDFLKEARRPEKDSLRGSNFALAVKVPNSPFYTLLDDTQPLKEINDTSLYAIIPFTVECGPWPFCNVADKSFYIVDRNECHDKTFEWLKVMVGKEVRKKQNFKISSLVLKAKKNYITDDKEAVDETREIGKTGVSHLELMPVYVCPPLHILLPQGKLLSVFQGSHLKTLKVFTHYFKQFLTYDVSPEDSQQACDLLKGIFDFYAFVESPQLNDASYKELNAASSPSLDVISVKKHPFLSLNRPFPRQYTLETLQKMVEKPPHKAFFSEGEDEPLSYLSPAKTGVCISMFLGALYGIYRYLNSRFWQHSKNKVHHVVKILTFLRTKLSVTVYEEVERMIFALHKLTPQERAILHALMIKQGVLK